MSQISLFGIGQAAKSPFVTAKMMQNLYAEVRPQGEKSSLVAYGTPGLSAPLVDFGATPIRGGREFPGLSVCYVVHRGTFWEVNNAGTATNRGTLLTTTGRVSISDNGVQVMIVDGSYGYIFNTATNAFTQNVLSGLPAAAQFPTTVTYLGRRFVVNSSGSGRFYCSNVDDGLTWDTLNFSNAETNPDPIIAVWTSNGQLAMFGSQTTEYWGLSGAVDFPYSLVSGTATEWGLAATWSIAKFDNSVACLMKNAQGQVIVARIQGYTPSKISTPDMDSIINEYANTADATAYSYMLGGHAMYVISFPSAGATWMFDGSTGFWSSLKSYGLTRYRGEFAFSFLSDIVIADYSVGRLYRLSPTTYTDNGDRIEREVIGETIRAPDGEFISINCLRVDAEVGVGLAGNPGIPYTLNYLNLPGGLTDYVAATVAASTITGDFEVEAWILPDDYTVNGTIIAKWTKTGDQKGYGVRIGTGGVVIVNWSSTGLDDLTCSITPSVAFTNGVATWIRVTFDVDNGAGGYTAALYSSTDGVTWVANGSTVTGAGVATIFACTSPVTLGARISSGFGTGPFTYTGKIYRVRLYSAGTLVASFSADDGDPGDTSVVSGGNTWALYSSTSIVSTTVTPTATLGANPLIALSISRDNGKTWGPDMWKPLGQTGQYSTRVEWRRLGSPRVFTPKIRITDPVPVTLVSASVNPST